MQESTEAPLGPSRETEARKTKNPYQEQKPQHRSEKLFSPPKDDG